ncbi:MAG: hypothetical protein JWQ57_3230 [Mucilaginibacter sp.]|nr:hypothetical protein [Mucilaginibacter sp.]
MDIDEIITEFGAYYIAGGQNMNRLVKQLNQAAVTETLLTPMITDDTLYRGAETQFSRVVQPFQKAWTPLSPLKAVPVEIKLFNQKVDLDESPHVLEATWLGFLTGPEIDPLQWPFIRWYIEVHLLPQIIQDIELNEIYAGIFIAPTDGVAGVAGSSMDGIKKIINGHIGTGRTNPIALGAIPDTSDLDVYEYFEQFADLIGKKYWNIDMVIGCGQDIARKAMRGKRQKYGLHIDSALVKDLNTVADTNLRFLGLPSMNGAGKIWCTPLWNAAYFRKKTQNQKQFKIESIKRVLSLYTDWWNGVGFHIPEIIFTNDQDLS